MVQVIQAGRQKKPSYTESILGGFSSGLPEAIKTIASKHTQARIGDKLKELTGMDLSGLDPDMQKALAVQLIKGTQKSQLQNQKEGFLGQIFGDKQQSPEQELRQISKSPFDSGQLTDEQIAQATSLDPNLGRSLMHAKDVALREKRSAQEFEHKEKLASPEYQREHQITQEQAKADIKYNQELQSAEKQHKLKSQSLNRLEALNKRGVTGKPFEKLLEKTGLIALTSDGRREFAADVKNLITDIRSILGSQFSQFEFQTILNAYPSPDFSKEANAAIIKNLQDFQDIRNQEFEIAKDIKKENKGKIPADFQSQVNERLQQYSQTKLPEIKENSRKIMNEEYGIPQGFTLMFDHQGNTLSVPESDIEMLVEQGAILP